MKTKVLLLILVIILPFSLLSQNENDALRYTKQFIGGTARSLSMGNAFGALGGDMVALNYNPAGIAVFRQNELSFTPNLYYNLSDSKYSLGSGSGSDDKYNFNLTNIGIIGSYGNESDEGWANFNFGATYNKTNNFNRNFIIKGVNPGNSIVRYWVNEANANAQNTDGTKNPDKLDNFGNGLAYDTYLIDLDKDNNEYWSHITDAGVYGLLQHDVVSTKGTSGEYAFSFGANYAHKLYIGASFGITNLRYESNSEYSESDDTPATDKFQSFSYKEYLKTTGSGFNFKIGALYRANDYLRFGLAFHTPTFWKLDESYDATLIYTDQDAMDPAKSPVNDFSYELTTPTKAIASAALLFNKSGLISVDCEYYDYSKTKLRSSDYTFSDENSAIKDKFKGAINLRVGGEYRIGIFSLRGGYSLYGSPYSSTNGIKDEAINTVSGGFGINNGNFYMDFAYLKSFSNNTYQFFNMAPSEQLGGADITSTTNNMLLTLGFRF